MAAAHGGLDADAGRSRIRRVAHEAYYCAGSIRELDCAARARNQSPGAGLRVCDRVARELNRALDSGLWSRVYREADMTIGRVANAAGVSIDTIRFYERRGLLAMPDRSFSGYRNYSEEALDRLRFIGDAKRLGFTLKEIKELLSLGVKSTAECGPVTRKAEAKLLEMNEEIGRLQRLRLTLRKMIEECGGECMPTHVSRGRKKEISWKS